MSSINGDLHQNFCKAFQSAHPHISAQNSQRKTNEEWRDVKSQFQKKDPKLKEFILNRIKHYTLVSAEKKARHTITMVNFLNKPASSSVSLRSLIVYFFLFYFIFI